VLGKAIGRDDMNCRIDSVSSCSLDIGLAPPGVNEASNRLRDPRLGTVVIGVDTDEGTDPNPSKLSEGDSAHGAQPDYHHAARIEIRCRVGYPFELERIHRLASPGISRPLVPLEPTLPGAGADTAVRLSRFLAFEAIRRCAEIKRSC
jgi:hypothetical protein